MRYETRDKSIPENKAPVALGKYEGLPRNLLCGNGRHRGLQHLQLTVPYFSGKIVDLFLTGENARENLSTHRDLFYQLILAMVLFTLLRCVIVYGVCMIYEHVSQTVLYRVRNYLYDKIQRQDMTFYSTYRTGDLMTRLTGDLDAIRHMVAWIIRMVIESFSLFAAAAIFFL